MKNKNVLIILVAFISFETFGAITLKDSFEAAKANMETLKRAQAQVTQSEEQKIRARAAVLPTISGVGSYTKIDPPVGAGASPFLLTRQYSAAIRLSQPILRGGSVSGYRLAQENALLAKFQKDASEINLYQLVIGAYYHLSVAQMDVKNVTELLNFSRDRVKEIRERTFIGRSRKGELVEAEAQLHIAESQYQETLIALQEAEKNFEFYTNKKPEEITVDKNIPEVKGKVAEYLQKVRTRPDILAVQQQTKVAGTQIEIARGGHFPQVDLTSNYYFDRTGVLSTSEWDVGVAVVIPLFQGGGVQASVREAVEGKRVAELRMSETIRAAERDLAINYQNLLIIQDQLKSLKEALKKAEEVYRLNKKDYGYGLVTNLDVLQSLNVFIQTKRQFDGLVSIAHLNQKNLEALTGVLP
jgi:outer membrane protein TolC